MAFDPSSAQLVEQAPVAGFDPSSAQLVEQEAPVMEQDLPQAAAPSDFDAPPQASLPIGQQIGQALDKVANSDVVNKINALGGGVQSALANTVGAIPGLKGAEETLAPPSFVKESMEENPMTAMTGKWAGYLGAGAALTGAAATGLGAAGVTNGVLNSIGANALVGSLMAGEGNRTLGAAIGGGTAGAIGVAAKGIKSLANSASLGTKVKEYVGDLSKNIKGPADEVAVKSQANMWTAKNAVDAENFKAFNVEGARNTVPVNASKAAQKILDELDDPRKLGELKGQALDIVEQIAGWNSKKSVNVPGSQFLDDTGQSLSPATTRTVNSMTRFSVQELHSARKGLDQLISQARTQAEKGEINRQTFQDLFSLRAPLETDLLVAAKKAGMEQQYLKANKFYKSDILPLLDTGAKETADVLKNAEGNPLEYARLADGLIDRYIKPGKPNTATAFLNTLDDTGRAAVESRIVNKTLQSATNTAGEIDFLKFKDQLGGYKDYMTKPSQQLTEGVMKVIEDGTKLFNPTKGIPLPVIGGKVGLAATGAGIGYYQNGTEGAIAGLALGAGLSKMINSKRGQSFLMKISQPGGSKMAEQLVNTLAIQSILSGGEMRPDGN